MIMQRYENIMNFPRISRFFFAFLRKKSAIGGPFFGLVDAISTSAFYAVFLVVVALNKGLGGDSIRNAIVSVQANEFTGILMIPGITDLID